MYKIGLVEQNEELRTCLTQFLLAANFEVIELEQSAIQQDIDKHHPDFLIMDISMPNDGLVQTCNAIKLHKNTKYLPLIVLSNNPIIKQKVLISCTDQVMDKPFKIQNLIGSINSRLEIIHSLVVLN